MTHSSTMAPPTTTPSSTRRTKRRRTSLAVAAAAAAATALVSATVLLGSTSHALQTRPLATGTTASARYASSPLLPAPLGETCPQPLAAASLLEQRTLLASGGGPGLESPSEFDLSVGKALDTLRRDYQAILTQQPDFSIYRDDITVVDPSGVTLHGLPTYRNSFRLLHAIIRFVYCPNRSNLTFRLCYDQARRSIRVHWNARILPRFSLLPTSQRRPLHVDGISVYELDRATGAVAVHRIEHLLMNSVPLRPEEGVFAALEEQHAMSVPSFAAPGPLGGVGPGGSLRVEFRPHPVPRGLPGLLGGLTGAPTSSLFAMVGQQEHEGDAAALQSHGTPAASTATLADPYPGLDWAALEAKNKSRQKFGLKPVTPEEFLELQAQVADLAAQQRERQEQLRREQEAARQAQEQSPRPPNFLQQLFGQVLPDTCESNFDCERPKVCCDFGVRKVCCAGGLPVVDGPRRAMVPVPVGAADDEYGYPRGRGPTDGAGNERLW